MNHKNVISTTQKILILFLVFQSLSTVTACAAIEDDKQLGFDKKLYREKEVHFQENTSRGGGLFERQKSISMSFKRTMGGGGGTVGGG